MADQKDEATGVEGQEVILLPGTDEPPTTPDTAEPPSQAPAPGEHPLTQQELDQEREAQESLYPTTKPSKGGHVTFGGPTERRQSSELAAQITRATEHQLETASEHIQHIGWIETDGSRSIPGKSDLEITRFELILSSGKIYTLEGPLIHLKIQN